MKLKQQLSTVLLYTGGIVGAQYQLTYFSESCAKLAPIAESHYFHIATILSFE